MHRHSLLLLPAGRDPSHASPNPRLSRARLWYRAGRGDWHATTGTAAFGAAGACGLWPCPPWPHKRRKQLALAVFGHARRLFGGLRGVKRAVPLREPAQSTRPSQDHRRDLVRRRRRRAGVEQTHQGFGQWGPKPSSFHDSYGTALCQSLCPVAGPLEGCPGSSVAIVIRVAWNWLRASTSS